MSCLNLGSTAHVFHSLLVTVNVLVPVNVRATRAR